MKLTLLCLAFNLSNGYSKNIFLPIKTKLKVHHLHGKDFPSVVPVPAALELPENFLEMNISETYEVRLKHSVF